MKVELHLHTSRYSGCATATPKDLMRALVREGYGAVFITEHDHIWEQGELDDLQRDFPSLRIFPGVELGYGDVRAEHLLVLGTQDPSYLRLGSPLLAIQKARRDGHLAILAHPFRWTGGDELLNSPYLPDAIEWRTCNQDAKAGDLAQATGTKLRIPLVNAGDTHSVEMVGRFWIETKQPLKKANDIRQIVISGAYQNRTRD